ncbi:MAG TPA: aldehyde dehydrogenase family protein, partial [Pyrinomonadaceae bacterium]|nr:aldehyde dehydrogenase family protein [Pyrinomonadaceae bacterium]
TLCMASESNSAETIARTEADEAVKKAYAAYLEIAKFDQDRIDTICDRMAAAALEQAERLGQLAHEETGFGKPLDKKEKNRFAAEDVWNHFKSIKTVGVINETRTVVEIASPRGVVAAIIPSTNPTSTAIFKIIIAIKSRNSLVLSPHPAAKKCIAETARIMRDAGSAEGLPPEAIQCLENTHIKGTEELMKHRLTAVILATGGIGLVRAAYSSGKPAFGVGPGNVPVYIERSADVEKAVADILTGTCFDNGTICASEQSVVVDKEIADAVRKQFSLQGGYFLDSSQAQKVAEVLLTPERTLNPKIVGKSAQFIAEMAGISIPGDVRCLIADCFGVGREHPWSIEKLSPTLAFFEVSGVEEAARRCDEILHFGGMGHTAGMHTTDRSKAIEYGRRMPAARIVINSPTTHGAIGLSTDLPPSMTLGCGSWGGNVTSDNVSPLHLLDIKRIAFETKPVNKKLQAKVKEVSATETDTVGRRTISRQEIAEIVDRFLTERPQMMEQAATGTAETAETKPEPQKVDSPVKTIIHELRPAASDNGKSRTPVDFVSETDVRSAIEKGEKIYVHSKTIITPAARDLGEEREVFVRT